MKLLQLSDIHFGAEDEEALAGVERIVADHRPDALIVCGDLTQRGKRREFEAASDWIRQFGRPTLVVPGNHDTPLLNLVERVTSPFERFEASFGDLAGPLEVGDWRFCGLNTARGWQARRNWAEGVVDMEALAAAAASDRYTAIVCHHPFVSPPGTPLLTHTRRGAAADALLKSSSATLLLTGHVHAPTVELRGGTNGAYLAATAGTLSRRLRGHPPGCNLLMIDGASVKVSSVSVAEGAVDITDLGTFSARPGTEITPER